MKVAVVGSRSFTNYELLNTILSEYKISEIVSGGAHGADVLAEKYAITNNIPTKIFYPDWKIGRAAGPIRNKYIVDYADIIISFWDGKSKGTESTIKYSKSKEKECIIISI